MHGNDDDGDCVVFSGSSMGAAQAHVSTPLHSSRVENWQPPITPIPSVGGGLMASYFNVPPGCDNLWVKDPPRIVIYAARGRQTLGTA